MFVIRANLFRHYDVDNGGSLDLEELQELWKIEFGEKPQMKVVLQYYYFYKSQT